MLHVARLAQLRGGTLLLYLPLRIVRVLACTLCLLALAPVATFLRSGVTADTLTTALAKSVYLPLTLAVLAVGGGSVAVTVARLAIDRWRRSHAGGPPIVVASRALGSRSACTTRS